ncbi:MAG: secondary thiamine-phosphate synthase enzyme YjbQ [bacterium]|nr:secondary thiamine-phosphate synthase enzyme YjbQ [bacterium]
MTFAVETKGHYDFVNVTKEVSSAVSSSGVSSGMAHVFVLHTTAVLTVMEWEEGSMQDMKAVFEAWAPEDADYKHHLRWRDHNGAAHIKAAIIGADVTVPIENGKLQLGTWQQIVLIDFDERPRTRQLSIKILEEGKA